MTDTEDKRTVFITGGAGWIGGHVITELLEHGRTISALAHSEASIQKLTDRGVRVVNGSLEDTSVLHQAAKDVDAVIHLAHIHDFSPEGQKRAHAADLGAIDALASALEGTNKPFIYTSGVFAAGRGELSESSPGIWGPRAEAESRALSYGSKGVRSVVIRPGVSNHGDGDSGFISMIINMSRKNGIVAYVENGANRWPVVHVKDTAVLYRLAIEKDHLPSGIVLHSVAEEGIKFKDIAQVIGKKLGVNVQSISKEDASKYFGGLAVFICVDANASSEKSKQLTGWSPKEKGLLEDLEQGTYFY